MSILTRFSTLPMPGGAHRKWYSSPQLEAQTRAALLETVRHR